MRCSEKVQYDTRSRAKRSAKIVKAAGRGNLWGARPGTSSRMRVYQCPECGMYHLTSKSRGADKR